MTTGSAGSGFVHSAVCHNSDGELVEALLPFVEDGLHSAEPVFVNLVSERVEALRSALGVDARRVRWSDTQEWFPHPTRRLRAVSELVDDQLRHGSGRLRFVGECAWPAEPPELVTEWERFEAVLNEALAGTPVTMVCTYDAGALPAEVIDRVALAHPLLGAGPMHGSPSYLGAAGFLATRSVGPLHVPPVAWRSGGRVTPADARAHLREMLAGDPSDAEVLGELAVVVTEIVANSWRAGATSIELACWWDKGDAVAQVDDDGPGFSDPLAGYRRPPLGAEGGRGLWIARQLADLVEIATGSSGTRVRVRMRAPGVGRAGRSAGTPRMSRGDRGPAREPRAVVPPALHAT